jgi:hypothetical protein
VVDPTPEVSVLNVDPTPKVLPDEIVFTPSGKWVWQRSYEVSIIAQKRDRWRAVDCFKPTHCRQQGKTVQIAQVNITRVKHGIAISWFEWEMPSSLT